MFFIFCFEFAGKNRCWDKTLNRIGFPKNHRQFQGICLLGTDDASTRIQMHDCFQEYQKGDFAYHGHNPPSHCQILEVSGVQVPTILQGIYSSMQICLIPQNQKFFILKINSRISALITVLGSLIPTSQ